MIVKTAGQERLSRKSLSMISQLESRKRGAFAEAVPLTCFFFPPHFGILVVQKCHDVAYCLWIFFTPWKSVILGGFSSCSVKDCFPSFTLLCQSLSVGPTMLPFSPLVFGQDLPEFPFLDSLGSQGRP